jgi:hypothetical protein
MRIRVNNGYRDDQAAAMSNEYQVFYGVTNGKSKYEVSGSG